MRTPRQAIREDINRVARTYGVTYDDIIQKNRTAPVVKARNAAYWRIWKKYGYSLLQLGRIFNRNHVAVLRGIGAHMHRRRIKHPWAQLYRDWKETLRQQYERRRISEGNQ